MIIENMTKKTVLGNNIKLADKFVSRFIGLMFKKSLTQGNGLLIVPCSSIHMMFMKFPLDIIFIDKNNTIISIVENIKPWHVSKIYSQSKMVLELPARTVLHTDSCVGDVLSFKQNPTAAFVSF